jgi:hypothetical protein
MKEKPRVGQKVRLNNHGLYQTFGSPFGLSLMKNKIMAITWVDDESITDDVDTWVVEVDDRVINQFLIDNHCFDSAEPGDGYAIVIEGGEKA